MSNTSAYYEPFEDQRWLNQPFGFSSTDPSRMNRPADYYLNSDHVTYGYSEAILPAIRWSNYQLAEGGGMALLDQGLTGHELNDHTVTLGLLNAQSNYRTRRTNCCVDWECMSSTTPFCPMPEAGRRRRSPAGPGNSMRRCMRMPAADWRSPRAS